MILQSLLFNFQNTTPYLRKMIRKLYIAYRKDRKHDAFVENVVDYLLKIK